jgi:hypothetical protein
VEVSGEGRGTHEIRRCGGNTVQTIDHSILCVEDLFKCLPCRARRILVFVQCEKEICIPRASFCTSSVIDSSGPAITSTSQSVASADALDITRGLNGKDDRRWVTYSKHLLTRCVTSRASLYRGARACQLKWRRRCRGRLGNKLSHPYLISALSGITIQVNRRRGMRERPVSHHSGPNPGH